MSCNIIEQNIVTGATGECFHFRPLTKHFNLEVSSDVRTKCLFKVREM